MPLPNELPEERMRILTPIPIQAQKSIYPFHDGSFEDFEPVFEKLIAVRAMVLQD